MRLPLPGAASSSWSMYRARIASLLEEHTVRTAIAFWLLGLINNLLYVIILSAALDLVGPSVPKSLVLLFDVVPSFFVKLTAPYYIHAVPYSIRVLLFAALSTVGMLIIALTPSSIASGSHVHQEHGIPDAKEVAIKMTGVVLASLSSGGGELSFLGLSSFYGPASLAAWGSGTGGAGLVGAGAYVLATTTLKLPIRTSLLVFSFLPVVLIISFFVILPQGPLRRRQRKYQPVAERDEDDVEDEEDIAGSHSGLLRQSSSPTRSNSGSIKSRALTENPLAGLKANLKRSQKLIIPYMLPLFMVYCAEYTINQGVAPTLLFPLKSSPFSEYRDFYPTYNALYQVGVFISRSSLPFIRIKALYTPSFLQCLNLAMLTAHALHPYLPTVWYVFVIVFWEGLLGGIVYVSTFRRIDEEVPEDEREFSLGATTVSDSGGICVAGFIGMAMETGLCRWQVQHGRDWCTKL